MYGRFEDQSPFQAILKLTLGYALLGLGLMIYGMYQSRVLDRAKSWQATTGRVVKVEVRERLRRPDVRITYTYRVYGKTYVSDRYSPLSRTAPLEAQHRYQPGQVVRVYFDPGHPGRAVLTLRDPSSLPPSVWQFVGGMILLMSPALAISSWFTSKLFPYSFGRWRF